MGSIVYTRKNTGDTDTLALITASILKSSTHMRLPTWIRRGREVIGTRRRGHTLRRMIGTQMWRIFADEVIGHPATHRWRNTIGASSSGPSPSGNNRGTPRKSMGMMVVMVVVKIAGLSMIIPGVIHGQRHVLSLPGTVAVKVVLRSEKAEMKMRAIIQIRRRGKRHCRRFKVASKIRQSACGPGIIITNCL